MRRDVPPVRRLELAAERRPSTPARLAALALVTVAALALTSSPASAAQQYPFDGQLKIAESLLGVAVDGKTGDALVSDFNSSGQVVDVFDAAGTQVQTLNGTDTPAGSFGNGYIPVAADDSSGAIYVADQTSNVVDVLNSSGSYVCQITGAGSSTTSASECDSADPGTPAGNLGSPEAVAVDQATGDVYVYDEVNAVIDVFDSTGKYLRQINGASTAAGSFSPFVRSLAVDDSTGELLVGDGGPDLIYVFDAATGAYVTTWDGSASANPPGTPSGSFGSGALGVAVDDSTGDVYVSDSSDTVVDQLNQSGSYLGQLTGTPGGSFADPEQVAIGQATGRLYVVDGDQRVVDIFSDQQVTVPDVTIGSASGLTATAATLHGSVNPDGIQVTDCHFDYGTTTSYGQTAPCLRDDNNSTDVGVGTSDVPVHADLAGLTPGTSYHFRLGAGDANGTNYGADQTFTTLPVPVIDEATATNVTPSSADLNAQINPEGVDTTYHFEYGTNTTYGTSVPIPDADIGSGASDVGVSQQITGLTANTEYHWRVIASNANGTTTGVDHTFVYDTSGGGLPDGRAYEMVTPPQKNGALIGDVLTGLPTDFADDGSRVIASSLQCFADTASCTGLRATAGSLYEFTRTASGWVANSMTPPADLYPINTAWTASANAGTALFSVPTQPDGEDDFYARRPDGTFSHIGPVSPPTAGGEGPVGAGTVMASTADLSDIVWAAAQPHPLWPFDTTNPGANSLYEYAGPGTQPVLVGVNGGPGSTDLISVCGTQLGESGTAVVGMMSSDGSIVYFTAVGKLTGVSPACVAPQAPAADTIEARVDGTSADAHTVAISQRSPADCTTAACTSSSPGDANFEGASTDGSKAFFTSTQQLTDTASEDSQAGDTARGQGCASTTGPNGCNLYLYDFDQPAGHELIDASAGDTSGGGPRVQGVVAISPDSSHAYFVAKGVLTATANSQGQTPQAGAENLYVYERDADHPDGQIAFIATLPASDLQDWSGAQGTVANVSPDGRYLVFTSQGDLTADDSSSGGRQVFRYDAQAGTLQRISIGNNGYGDNGNFAGSGCEPSYCPEDESIVPPLMTHSGVPRTDPTMSDDGARVFFESPDGLTPGALDDVRIATNGDGTGNPIYAQNIYEWEQAGVGSCPASQATGCVYLISGGHDVGVYAGQSDVHLIGTDTTGANMFFKTSDQLVPQDTDTEEDIYDARIGGGFPYTPPPQPCQGDACQGTPTSAPPPPTVATVTFSGPGNSTAGATTRTGKVKVVRKTVKGSAFSVRVKVPAAGRLTIIAAGIRTAHKSVTRAGTYRLRVSLTARERRRLSHKRRLKLEVRVTYAPIHGSTSHVTFSITDKA